MSSWRERLYRGARAVATRILLSYVIVLSIFAASSLWSVWTFRTAVNEATVLRQGYLPLALHVRGWVTNQDTWNTQLNHVTTAGNPADIRVWFETALAVGRPKKIQEVRSAVRQAFPVETHEKQALQTELLAEVDRIELFMQADQGRVGDLFDALTRGNQEQAWSARDELVKNGLKVQRELVRLEERISLHIDAMVDSAHVREQTALRLMSWVGLVTVLVGALLALYARRVVAPLTRITGRARAVAAGDLAVHPVIDAGGEIGELSATFESMVQAILSARERLLATERLAAIGKMAAHVTHEVRNPLSSIALNLDLLEEELDPNNEEARELLRAIEQEVQRLSDLSDQYLSMARRKTPELQVGDVTQIVQGAVSFVRREMERSGIEVRVELAPELPLVQVDSAQLRQALYNLLRNAREALVEGGQIRIVVSADEQALHIAVEDNGPGISLEQKELLFDPFFTTKDHGTGLGLAVTREIIAVHGGSLQYEALTPRGARFVMTLPLAEARGDSGEASSALS